MKTDMLCFEIRQSVALAWYYAIANWPGWTHLPRFDVSGGPMKVYVQRNDAVIEDLRNALKRAELGREASMASSARALLGEIDARMKSSPPTQQHRDSNGAIAG